MAPTRTTRTRSTTASSGRGNRNASGARDESIVARTGRTLKERPYTSAAIATGAVTAVAAAAAGAFFFSRRDRSASEPSESVTSKVKGSFADARARIKDLIHSDDKSQQEIAEEALTLKESGNTRSAREDRSTSSKAGAIAY
jgi:hypothetical protein